MGGGGPPWAFAKGMRRLKVVLAKSAACNHQPCRSAVVAVSCVKVSEGADMQQQLTS